MGVRLHDLLEFQLGNWLAPAQASALVTLIAASKVAHLRGELYTYVRGPSYFNRTLTIDAKDNVFRECK